MSRSGSRRPPAAAIALAFAAAIAPLAPDGWAKDPEGNQAPVVPSDIAVEAVPVLGTGANIAYGWNQVVVRVQNNGTKPARGRVEVSSRSFGREVHDFRSTAPFNVGAGASVHVRAPAQVALYGNLHVDVLNEAGTAKISEATFASFPATGVTLLDVSEASALRGAVNEAVIAPRFTAPSASSRGTAQTLSVVSPRFDPATGDPLLPDRAALYGSVDAVLMRSDVLARLAGADLDALAGYLLAGGTLAVAIVRPEDIRNPTLVALAGGTIVRQGVSAVALAEIAPPSPSGSVPSTAKTIPHARAPGLEIVESLTGWAGGNLRGSSYGNSAIYGLGEVHLLAFDPTRKPAVDDPWVQARMVDLARRAYERRSTQIFRPGSEIVSPNLSRVRQQLDPNENSRWAIGAAALLLCIYAVLAGPINFSFASKKGKPLRALRFLPIFAAGAFACIVGIGMIAKGVTGRARHLTLLEAGAGMSKGSARRWRGFFASRAKDLTVRTTDGSSVVSTAILAESAERKDRLLVDRDGARLTEVAALPWQTVVVREDGFGSLGDGISLVKDGEAGVAIANRSGRDLRSAILRIPSGATFYYARVKDGDKVTSNGATPLASRPEGAIWEAQMSTGYRAGSIDVHRLAASALQRVLDPDAPGLADAWWALEDAAGDAVDWFPDGVPVLIGQLDGGEGRASDSGLRLESDRLLVRVVGWGGKL